MRIGALIPARAGSKRVPGKNTRPLCGKPLFLWSVQAARRAGIEDVFVSTNDPHIQPEEDFQIIARPSELATDDATLEGVIHHAALMKPEIDYWITLQPTSPLRTFSYVMRAAGIAERGASSVSLTSLPQMHFQWVRRGDEMEPAYRTRPPTQELSHLYYENGAIYGISRQRFLETMCRYDASNVAPVFMYRCDSIDIDNEDDFLVAEAVMKEKLRDE